MARPLLVSPSMAGTAAERALLADYYRTVAPFHDAEMALRADAPDWIRIVEAMGAKSAIDIGCGSGRIARALLSRVRVVGVDVLSELLPRDPGFAFVQGDMRVLPLASGGFDVAVAADDPFAHLLDDADRVAALDEAHRVARRVVIDGLSLTATEDARSRATSYVRKAALPDGTVRHETWRAVGELRYRTTYRYLREDTVIAEAATYMRAWSRDEPALRGRWARFYGGLDGRPYDGQGRGLVISIGGAL